MNYRIIEESEYPRWDRFVDISPQGSIYSKSFYLKCIGCRFNIAVVENDGCITGGIVLTKNEVGVFSNPLFVKHLGILYRPAEGKPTKYQSMTYKIDRQIISNIADLKVWSYSFHPNFKNWLNFYQAGYKQTTRYTYQIHFSRSADFRTNYGQKAVTPLKAAKKHHLTIEDVDIETFVEVNKKTYLARNSKPPYTKKRLARLLRNLANQKCLYAKSVKDGLGNVHCAAAVVYDESSANLILNGSDPAYRKFAGNTLLIDHMIEFAAKNCRFFDFEGSMHERIERFYRGFGGRVIPYYVIYKGNLPTCLYRFLLNTAKKRL